MSEEDEEIRCASCGKILKEEDVYYEEKTDLPYCDKCAKEKTYEAQRQKPLSKEEMLEQRIKDLEARLNARAPEIGDAFLVALGTIIVSLVIDLPLIWFYLNFWNMSTWTSILFIFSIEFLNLMVFAWFILWAVEGQKES